jgi:OOP family OmpA-OmpF porin
MGHLNRSASDLTGLNNATLDDNDTTWTVRGGWRFSPYAAVELGYYDFGRYDFHGTAVGNLVPVDGSAKAQSVILSLVGIIPINSVDLYGRIGWAHSELKFNANGPINTSNQNERQDEAAYGVGARWWFAPNWGVFAEWAKNDRIRVDSYVAGVDFRF